MKKLLAAILMVMLTASFSWAAGTATVSNVEKIRFAGDVQRVIVTITWTDDTAGTTLAVDPATYGVKGWYLVQAETNPGSPAPTADYDIVLTTTSGLDLAVGLLANRHTSTTQRVSIATSTLAYPMAIESFTFTLSGNSQAGATGTLKLIFTAN